MAATANSQIISSTTENSFVKALAESSTLKSIPTEFTFPNDYTCSNPNSLPTVDFSLLISPDPDQRSKTLHELAGACEQWGFFVLVNHGIPESVLKGAIEASLEYFDLPAEEKRRYEEKSPSDPIKSGSGSVINTNNHRIHLWRDYVKSYVHPQFHCPDQPTHLRYNGDIRISGGRLKTPKLDEKMPLWHPVGDALSDI